MLQKQQGSVVRWLVEIYLKTHTHGFHTESELAIWLLAFLLNLLSLECVLDIRLRMPFSKAQHAYLKGESTEPARHGVICTV